ncbi:hypothetical protein [Streptomyces glycanivorans]|uniref:Uncharacterized protein n=1 Tax=Streptomyces glycanivorans TaxID=3033808 RepID=A0ABY9JKF0_9ACTN|nr:hypothetical protein [Streptomyces sp. Alt3]WLQ67600.1 hypothetical protein P8A20_30320 [Streptomyces sp. Alt3]
MIPLAVALVLILHDGHARAASNAQGSAPLRAEAGRMFTGVQCRCRAAWAPAGGVTTTAVFDTGGWNGTAERNVVRAFVSLLRRRRFFEYKKSETLFGLLKASLTAGEDVTEALGIQVRQAVELLVDVIGRADVRAMDVGALGLHAMGVAADEVYRGAVAVMMRVVFLVYAEERGLLPANTAVYATAYSTRFLRAELKARADARSFLPVRPGRLRRDPPDYRSMQGDEPLCSDGWKSLPDVASDVI